MLVLHYYLPVYYIAKMYLLKKNRFKNVDEFDRFRLQMMEQIGELSKVILDRLLDRTIVRTFSKFQVVVHLGNRRVVEIHALEGLPQVPLTLIFDEPQTLGKRETGAKTAMPIFKEFVKIAVKKKDARPFKVADKITMMVIDPKTGKKASFGTKKTIIEAYKKDKIEKKKCF